MTKPNDGLNFYRNMIGSLGRCVKRQPEGIESLIDELSDLIADFAPFAGSELGLDANDLEQILEAGGGNVKGHKLDRLKANGVFKNDLTKIYTMAQNSINKSNEEGDVILVAICKKIDEIADAVGYAGMAEILEEKA